LSKTETQVKTSAIHLIKVTTQNQQLEFNINDMILITLSQP